MEGRETILSFVLLNSVASNNYGFCHGSYFNFCCQSIVRTQNVFMVGSSTKRLHGPSRSSSSSSL